MRIDHLEPGGNAGTFGFAQEDVWIGGKAVHRGQEASTRGALPVDTSIASNGPPAAFRVSTRAGRVEDVAPSRSRAFAAAVLVSILLHALALWALWRVARRPLVPTAESQMVEIAMLDHLRAAPAARASTTLRALPLVAHPAAHPHGSAYATPEENPTPASRFHDSSVSPGATASGSAGRSRGAPADLPKGLVLEVPFRSFGAASDGERPGSGGETIVGMPAPEAPGVRADRARHTVDGWLADGAAEDRVAEGLVDDYYRSIGKSVEGAFADTEKQVRVKRGKGAVGAENAFLAWADSASRYAETGSPTERSPDIEDMQARYGLGPSSVGPDPGVNEQQRRVSPTASALPWFDGSSGGLVVIVEIRQQGDGKLLDVAIKRSSHDPDFDAWVLAEIPEGLAKLPPPPDFGPGLHKDGLRSVWAFEGKVSYMRKVDDIKMKDDWWYLPAAAALAMVGGHFDLGNSNPEMIDLRHPHFVVNAKLLRVY